MDTVTISREEYQAILNERTSLKSEVADLTIQLQWAMQQLKLSAYKRFGPSKEDIPPGQEFLFNEVEQECGPLEPKPQEQEVLGYKRKKRRGYREEMYEGLPEETVQYRLTAEEQICPECGKSLHEIGSEVHKELTIIPARVLVRKHECFIYGCRYCEREGIRTPIVTAKGPKAVIPGSFASPSSIAHVMNSKYIDALPLYRQEEAWSRLGVQLSRQTMANWVVRASRDWLTPIYNRMKARLLSSDCLHADETVLQVLHEPGRKAQSKSQMWMYRTGKYEEPVVLFDYQMNKRKENPKRFLQGFSGYLHVDGSPVYNNLGPNVKLAGCWAHARRKYHEALMSLPEKERKKPSSIRDGYEYCQRFFSMERKWKDLSPGERHEERLKFMVPVLDEFKTWLDQQNQRVLPKGYLAAAIAYCLGQWEKLTMFLKDGRLEMDNNRAERAIRSYVIGRVNWKFSNTPNGADASATVYSIVITAKENGLIPYEYLKYLFESLPNLDPKESGDPAVLDEYMPWSPSLPEYVKHPFPKPQTNAPAQSH